MASVSMDWSSFWIAVTVSLSAGIIMGVILFELAKRWNK